MSTALDRWAVQDAEWHTIRDKLIAARPGVGVTAYEVSLEQRKRMLERGERPVTYAMILADHEASPTASVPGGENRAWPEGINPECYGHLRMSHYGTCALGTKGCMRKHELRPADPVPPAETQLADPRGAACPCTLLEIACRAQCTCKNPHLSGGCLCCATYGSVAQRMAAARRIFDAVTKSRAEVAMPSPSIIARALRAYARDGQLFTEAGARQLEDVASTFEDIATDEKPGGRAVDSGSSGSDGGGT